MRVVFAGTPEFAVPALTALHSAGHELVGVLTQPDRPAGRGRKLQASAVARHAGTLGLPVAKPARIDDTALLQLRAWAPDVMVVVAYGRILPQRALDIPAHGCLNIHASLLPRWRGAAPLARAILAGDNETGICIMQMEAGLDTGPVLLCERTAIGGATTAGALAAQLAPIGAALIVRALAELPRLAPQPQPATGVTYAGKLTKEEARLDWRRPALELDRAVRAFNPAPIAWTELDGERVRVWRAQIEHATTAAEPGTVIAAGREGIVVQAAADALRIVEIQWPGGQVQGAAQAGAGRGLVGKRLT